MQHIMAVDARHRFVFGITIENTSLALWYINRSMLACSTPHDTTKSLDPSLLIFQLSCTSLEMPDPVVRICIRASMTCWEQLLTHVGGRHSTKLLQDHEIDVLLSRVAHH
jgi:hypothetical protein